MGSVDRLSFYSSFWLTCQLKLVSSLKNQATTFSGLHPFTFQEIFWNSSSAHLNLLLSCKEKAHNCLNVLDVRLAAGLSRNIPRAVYRTAIWLFIALNFTPVAYKCSLVRRLLSPRQRCLFIRSKKLPSHNTFGLVNQRNLSMFTFDEDQMVTQSVKQWRKSRTSDWSSVADLFPNDMCHKQFATFPAIASDPAHYPAKCAESTKV